MTSMGVERPEAHATFWSRMSTASDRLTDTSCETPRSAMVTPNSRFIRAIVIGLCVMMMKRVSVELVISCSRLQ
ncbi:hypothetical protein ACVW0J_008702 [Bradyrhizobium sp. i1.7.7]